jgi:hypothetical protein
MALPKLGDARKRYIVELTEPEINTLAALEGFVESACSREPSPWYEHYRPHIEAIATKFEPCEDGNAPFHGEGPRDLRAGGEGAEALYRAALRAISACKLIGVEYGDWTQAVCDDALDGIWPECYTCGTAIHDGPCVSKDPEEAKPHTGGPTK